MTCYLASMLMSNRQFEWVRWLLRCFFGSMAVAILYVWVTSAPEGLQVYAAALCMTFAWIKCMDALWETFKP